MSPVAALGASDGGERVQWRWLANGDERPTPHEPCGGAGNALGTPNTAGRPESRRVRATPTRGERVRGERGRGERRPSLPLLLTTFT